MATSTALVMMTSKPERTAKPSKKDKERYLLSRRGWTTEQLASRENVKETVIKDSIARYQLYRDSLAIDEQDLHIAEMTSRLMPGAEKVLAGAMKAERVMIVTKGGKSTTKKVVDHDTRIKAVETVKSFMETVRPKGGGININTQVNNGNQGGGAPTATRGFDFEARLRNIREKKGLVNDEVIPDAEFEDVQSTAAEELADIGIDIDEDEDDDEEEDEGGE